MRHGCDGSAESRAALHAMVAGAAKFVACAAAEAAGNAVDNFVQCWGRCAVNSLRSSSGGEIHTGNTVSVDKLIL
jgi:hypothetical protein